MITYNAIRNYKKGRRTPSLSRAKILAQMYNVTLDELARCLDEHRLPDKPVALPAPLVEQPPAPPAPSMPPVAGKAASRGKPIGYKPIYNAAGEVTGYMEDYGEVVPMDVRRERLPNAFDVPALAAGAAGSAQTGAAEELYDAPEYTTEAMVERLLKAKAAGSQPKALK
jgi:hypothetical protein